MSKKQGGIRHRQPCPECGSTLELEGHGVERVWRCTGLVDPENVHAELQPCLYQRDYGQKALFQDKLYNLLRLYQMGKFDTYSDVRAGKLDGPLTTLFDAITKVFEESQV